MPSCFGIRRLFMFNLSVLVVAFTLAALLVLEVSSKDRR
jgi:hypothetical protein